MIWIVLALCLPLCFILAGMESALLTLNKIRVRHAAEEGDPKAVRLDTMLNYRDDLLHIVASTNHIVGLLAFAGTSFLIVRVVGHWGWLINLLILLPIFVILLEQLPKQLFGQKPFLSLRLFTGLLALLYQLARPWLFILHKLKPRALELLPPEADNSGLDEFCKSIKKLKLLPELSVMWMDEYAAMQKAPTSSYMTPLRQLTALPPSLSLARWMNASLHHPAPQPWHIVLADDGKLLGWLDGTALPNNAPADKVISQYVRPLQNVKSTDPAWKTLQMLRRRGDPIAAVLDDKEEVLGIISQNNLVSQLLGTQLQQTSPKATQAA